MVDGEIPFNANSLSVLRISSFFSISVCSFLSVVIFGAISFCDKGVFINSNLEINLLFSPPPKASFSVYTINKYS